jgi:hypothetical protein
VCCNPLLLLLLLLLLPLAAFASPAGIASSDPSGDHDMRLKNTARDSS